MDKIRLSVVSSAALLGLTATASAGPMSVASPGVITSPNTQIQQVAYHYRHHYRHYVWHRGWHYGWYRTRYHHYAWRHHRYYAWNPAAAVVGGAVGLATLPFAVATGWPYYYGYPYYGYPYYY